jgi:hypothetical protein
MGGTRPDLVNENNVTVLSPLNGQQQSWVLVVAMKKLSRACGHVWRGRTDGSPAFGWGRVRGGSGEGEERWEWRRDGERRRGGEMVRGEGEERW